MAEPRGTTWWSEELASLMENPLPEHTPSTTSFEVFHQTEQEDWIWEVVVVLPFCGIRDREWRKEWGLRAALWGRWRPWEVELGGDWSRSGADWEKRDARERKKSREWRPGEILGFQFPFLFFSFLLTFGPSPFFISFCLFYHVYPLASIPPIY